MSELNLDKLEAAAQKAAEAWSFYQARDRGQATTELHESLSAAYEEYNRLQNPALVAELFARIRELEAAVASKEAEGRNAVIAIIKKQAAEWREQGEDETYFFDYATAADVLVHALERQHG